MVDIIIALWSELTDRGVGLLIMISIVLVFTAIFIGVKQYGKGYFSNMTHKRNLCWILGWLCALASLLLYFHFDIMSCCPSWLVILMLLLFGLFTVAVFKSVSGPVFLTRWYLKRYEKWLREGKAYEHRKCLDKRPWFVLDKNERIEYELLRARYLNNLGDIQGAYNAICKAEEMPMYPEEYIDLDTNRVFMLTQMGDIPKARRVLENLSAEDHPAYCFLHSFILEQEGKQDEAFSMAIEAENAMEPGYRNLRVRTALYNHLGRMYCFRNNESELFRYYMLAAKDAKKMGDMTQIQLVYQNLIDQHLICNRPKEDVEAIINEYTSLLKLDHADGICQIINLKLRLARHYNDRKTEHETILWGYEMLKKVSDQQAMCGHETNMLMMLHSGHLPLEPILTDVKHSFDSYFSLKMPMRFVVIWNLVQFLRVTRERFEQIDSWKNRLKQYLENYALNDLDDYQKQLPSYCVSERCRVLTWKVDVCALLEKESAKQLQWLKEIQQIYSDHGLLLNSALNHTHIAKFYAQQTAFNGMPAKIAYPAIRAEADCALELSEKIPWPYLGNLLIEIASGYGFINDLNKVSLVLKRFADLGLSEKHCGYDQKIELMQLKNALNKLDD